MTDSNPNVTVIASLIGDPSRLAMLMSLLGGKALPAGDLAHAARISPQTASSHLAKMVEGGLLLHESNGRHKYFRLANHEVGHALESLITIAPPKSVRSLRESDELKTLRHARTCYDHLAGKIGVALTDRLLDMKLLEESGNDYILRLEGKEKLRDFGVEVEEDPRKRRHYARQCLDWSERRHHLAGSLGAELTKRLFELKWIERIPNGRAVRVTNEGIQGLAGEFGLHYPFN
ncbi:ArsR family transcriptional regulator [Paenibacillus psychroresistens]|uniref:ArsR family transcriptional regulator n=1 Tax=Paenibacillus psychroresistens TaxID=1778678 RepID=A0A6B8RWU8_9BACL|nr:winged helix-turn-helix domain-containing protein [Paenibacillus psychroresistens]QGR00353.1 ArsR family transcriptional regulator [Paenibacillus psychroresistens]